MSSTVINDLLLQQSAAVAIHELLETTLCHNIFIILLL